LSDIYINMAKKKVENSNRSKSDIVKEIMVYIGAIVTIFGIGYKAGCFYMEIKCAEKHIQEIGNLQRERNELKSELDLCRNGNSSVTREEFEELKNNMNKYNKQYEISK